MTDSTAQILFEKSLSTSEFVRIRHGDSPAGGKSLSQFRGMDNEVSSIKTGSVLKRISPAFPDLKVIQPSLALLKRQYKMKGYPGAGEQIKEYVNGIGNPWAFNAFSIARRPFQSSWGVMPTFVNNNGGIFGTVGTGGAVNKPTSSPLPRPLPRPTIAALPTQNRTWVIVGGGDMNPTTTTTKTKSSGRSTVFALRNRIRAFRSLHELELQRHYMIRKADNYRWV